MARLLEFIEINIALPRCTALSTDSHDIIYKLILQREISLIFVSRQGIILDGYLQARGVECVPVRNTEFKVT